MLAEEGCELMFEMGFKIVKDMVRHAYMLDIDKEVIDNNETLENFDISFLL